MTGRNIALFMVMIAALLASNGCNPFERPPGKLVVVLVDTSVSVAQADRDLYKQNYLHVLGKLDPGDRLVFGPISASTANDFIAFADEDFPYTSRRLPDKKEAEKKRVTLKGAFNKVAWTAKRTSILDGLTIAEDLFAADGEASRTTRWLIILSDMLEVSEGLNFEQSAVSAALLEKVVTQRRSRESLPDLKGVSVFISGASAPEAAPASRYAEVENFWRGYFAKVGATVARGMYGHQALRLPGGSSSDH